MSKFRLAFMGTPDFAVPALRALVDAGHDVAAVYSQPPKPAGRGHHIQKSPVHNAADALGIPVHTPKTLRDAAEQKIFAELNLDIAIVVAYGLILPQPVLSAPKHGCLNIHASLLPRWRGAAPIQRSILAGDTETGVTIMKMDIGLDTGPMLLHETVAITPTTTAGTLHDQLMAMGSQLITQTLDQITTLPATPQPETGITYAAKLTREDGRIDWTKSATVIERQIRGLQPWPGCFFLIGNEPIKVLAAEITPTQSASPGTLLSDNLTIACGEGALHLKAVQRGGKNPTDGASFLRGQRLAMGHSFL